MAKEILFMGQPVVEKKESDGGIRYTLDKKGYEKVMDEKGLSKEVLGLIEVATAEIEESALDFVHEKTMKNKTTTSIILNSGGKTSERVKLNPKANKPIMSAVTNEDGKTINKRTGEYVWPAVSLKLMRKIPSQFRKEKVPTMLDAVAKAFALKAPKA